MAWLSSGILVHAARVLAAGGLAAGAAVAIRNARPGDEPGQAPFPAVVTATPAVVDQTARVAPAARYIYRTFSSETDALYVASTDPSVTPRKIADVPHARDWSINATVSPDGRLVAYAVMPPGARRSETDAELWVVGVDGSSPRRLATGIDLLARLTWTPAADAVVVRRYPKLVDGLPPQTLEVVALAGASRTVVSRKATLGLYPIAFAPDGRFYFAELSPGGTDIRSVKAGDDRLEFHASDGIARDWTLSPDGARLAFLAPNAAGAYRAFTADLGVASPRPAPARRGTGDELGPAWDGATGELTIGGPDTGTSAVVLNAAAVPVSPQSGAGFDQPIAWSDDGEFLALRRFNGAGVDDPGTSSDQLVTRGGARMSLPAKDSAFVGWVRG